MTFYWSKTLNNELKYDLIINEINIVRLGSKAHSLFEPKLNEDGDKVELSISEKLGRLSSLAQMIEENCKEENYEQNKKN
jgi:hypothetical protein